MDKLKRVVIKEEFVALTHNHVTAMILNQFLYWEYRKQEFKQFIAEEEQRSGRLIEIDKESLEYGWIYKSAKELKNELMVDDISEKTLLRRVDDLIQLGVLHRRRNPIYEWDKTYQYRVDLVKLKKLLLSVGYDLYDYKLSLNSNDDGHDAEHIGHDDGYEGHSVPLKRQNDEAIPEITTETTTEITSKTYSEERKEITDYLNNAKLRYTGEKGKYLPDSQVMKKYCNARLSEGYSVDDFKDVIDKKFAEWSGTKWEKYLRPSTLFNSEKFPAYLNEPRRQEDMIPADEIDFGSLANLDTNFGDNQYESPESYDNEDEDEIE